MTYEEKIKDLDELAELLNAIDILTKYHIFFSDVMRHRDDMIEKDKIFLKNLEQKLSYEDTRKQITRIVELTKQVKSKINSLCQKHNIDKRLQNRENIPLLKSSLQHNKKSDPTIEKVCNAIIRQNKVEDTIDTGTWCRILLEYDKSFTYYQKENPWLENNKRRKEKLTNAILFVPLLPLRFFVWQIKMLLAILGLSSKDLKKLSKSSYSFAPEDKFQELNQLYRTKNKYTFIDSKGNLCESGGLFYDSQGNLCGDGMPFGSPV